MRTGLSRQANPSLSVGTKSTGKGFARARDRAAFCTRNPPSPAAETGNASPTPAKLAEHGGFSRDRRKPYLYRNAWWGREDSNLQPSDYGPVAVSMIELLSARSGDDRGTLCFWGPYGHPGMGASRMPQFCPWACDHVMLRPAGNQPQDDPERTGFAVRTERRGERSERIMP
jgi:hypothetical protein